MQLHDHQKEIRPSGYGIFSEVWHSTPRVCLIRVPFSFACLWVSIRLVASAVFVRTQRTSPPCLGPCRRAPPQSLSRSIPPRRVLRRYPRATLAFSHFELRKKSALKTSVFQSRISCRLVQIHEKGEWVCAKSKACAVPGCGHRTPHAGHSAASCSPWPVSCAATPAAARLGV